MFWERSGIGPRDGGGIGVVHLELAKDIRFGLIAVTATRPGAAPVAVKLVDRRKVPAAGNRVERDAIVGAWGRIAFFVAVDDIVATATRG